MENKELFMTKEAAELELTKNVLYLQICGLGQLTNGDHVKIEDFYINYDDWYGSLYGVVYETKDKRKKCNYFMVYAGDHVYYFREMYHLAIRVIEALKTHNGIPEHIKNEIRKEYFGVDGGIKKKKK